MTRKGQKILALVALALAAALFFWAGRTLRFGEVEKTATMTEAQVLAVVTEKLVRSVDTMQQREEATKAVVVAQAETIARLVEEGKATSKALREATVAIRRYGDSLRSFAHVETLTRLDSVQGILSDSAASFYAGAMDVLAQVAKARQDAPPLTWSMNNEWVKQSFSYLPELRTGTFGLEVRNELGIAVVEVDGKPMMKVTNANPFTVTEDGTNLFELPEPKMALPRPKRKWVAFGFQAGAGKVIGGGFAPYVGIGGTLCLFSL